MILSFLFILFQIFYISVQERSNSHFDDGSSEIDFSELKFEEKIGEGTFGEVWKGTCRGKEVAIKKLKKEKSDENALCEFRKEIEIMRYTLFIIPF